MKRFKSIDCGDLISTGGRVWKVVGCYHGALGQESIIGLTALDKSPGDIGHGPRVEELLVPLDLISHDSIFRAVNHEEAAKPKLVAA